MPNSVATSLVLVRKNVASLAAELKADPASTLVALSKLMPVETLLLAYHENQRNFGENYVQEICECQQPTHPPTHSPTHVGARQVARAVGPAPAGAAQGGAAGRVLCPVGGCSFGLHQLRRV
jgi:hypothetical protein